MNDGNVTQRQKKPTTMQPVVEVELKGRKFYLEMTFAAMFAIEAQYGRDMIKDGFWEPEEIIKRGVRFLPEITTVMLNHADHDSIPEAARKYQKDITPEEFAKYLSGANFRDLVGAIYATLYPALVPPDAEQDAVDSDPPVPENGKRSTASGE